MSSDKLGPDFSPLIGTEFPASDGFLGFALDSYSEGDAAGPLPVHHFAHVPHSGAAPQSEGLSGLISTQRLDVFGKRHGEYYTRQCRPCQHQLVSDDLSNVQMADDAAIRHKNLLSLKLDWRALAGRVGGRDTYWRDMLKGNKSFGERIARKVEEKLGLPRGWLDETHEDVQREEAISYEAMLVAKVYDRLTPLERARFRRLMAASPDELSDDRPVFGELLGGDSNLGALDEARESKPTKVHKK